MIIWAIVLHCRSVPCLTNQDVLADDVLVSGDPADPESGAENFRKTSRARDVFLKFSAPDSGSAGSPETRTSSASTSWLVKQGTDLQCNTMAQMIIARYLQRYDIDRHIGKIVEVYKRRRDVAVGSIERYFPANIRFIRPEGGLFIWIELPTGISAREILNKCLEKK